MEAQFSLYQEEPPDTRHDAPTRRVPEGFHLDEPDDRRTTLPGGYGVEEGEAGESETDDEAETIRLDRNTLPSASEAPLLSPDRLSLLASFWLGLQHFCAERLARWRAALFCPSDSPPASFTRPLTSSAPADRPALQAVQDLIWTLEADELPALLTHVERVALLRKTGPEVYAEARLLDILALLEEAFGEEGVPLSALRARMPEVSRAAFDEAILGLERKTWVTLGTGKGPVDASAIWAPGRGYLGRCVLRGGRRR